MARTLSDEDVDAIAARVVEIIGIRLSAPKPPQAAPPAPPPPPAKPLKPKLAYTLQELSTELGISKVSLSRFEVRGLLKPLPYFRRKVFSREEVERFLSGRGGDIRPMVRLRGRGAAP
jgi:hypothetical protein